MLMLCWRENHISRPKPHLAHHRAACLKCWWAVLSLLLGCEQGGPWLQGQAPRDSTSEVEGCRMVKARIKLLYSISEWRKQGKSLPRILCCSGRAEMAILSFGGLNSIVWSTFMLMKTKIGYALSLPTLPPRYDASSDQFNGFYFYWNRPFHEVSLW